MKDVNAHRETGVMRPLKLLCVVITLMVQSCDTTSDFDGIQQRMTIDAPEKIYDPVSSAKKGYNETGIYKNFDCPDDLSFAPIDIRYWNKTPAITGRLPTYEDIKDGKAINFYGGFEQARPFYMKLPKLAYVYSQYKRKTELVVVIQIVQTSTDTVVGYRYLSGGCGGSMFHDFHFLTDEEIKKEMY
ncbi:MAG: hypothetical protein K0S53_685 [Bacteroidetes bacterium]|nr:hypothetical protein [Bacteroidota bacterium]